MKITLGAGIDDLLFGCTEDQAREILGCQEDKSYFSDSECHRLQFYDLRLELSFEPENDDRLGWIEIHHPQVLLFGHQLIGQRQQKVLEIVAEELGAFSEHHDYGSFESFDYDDQWLELQFKFGRLKCINFGVLYDENDEPFWPQVLTE